MNHTPGPALEGPETPAVVVDLEVLRRNVRRMADAAASAGLALRPHAKTHKIPEIGRLQVEAGAAGLTVATVGEAEVFAEHGIEVLFIAYPLWVTERMARRLLDLAGRVRLSFGVDSAEGAAHAARRLAAASGGAGGALPEVLVEVDSGHHRSGVAPGHALAVAEAARAGGLEVAGVFTFPGHSYGPGAAAGAAHSEHEALTEAASLLEEAGFEVRRRSGGSTPSALLTEPGGATEIRPGVYVFGDAQQLELGRCAAEDVALTVWSTVVSRHESPEGPRRTVLDAGSKVLGGDRPGWASGYGRLADHPEARIEALSEHHATVVWPEDRELPPLGSRLRVIPNHVCLVPNLVDEVLVDDGASLRAWRVAARGRNS
ncbi:alanine racemase [Rothia halotolerans]|uniref:alanine racemase n=1 Tax=Rothia halotolerans TaxID=405770 RepID=UPI00101BF0D9|nr:alanine racemase [Rothia halotolerans]